MDDVTDYVFREIVATTAKPDVLFTEFTSVDALFSRGHDKVVKKLKFSPVQHPVVAQIWGVIPENFYKAANYLQDLGFDGVDINMGCPVKNVMKSGAGAALIGNLPLVQEIIDAVRTGAPNLAFSIKTRLAKDPESTREWLTFLLSQKIDALILHGRDAKSLSMSPANWEEIGKAVGLRNIINPRIVLIGNGDVTSYQEVLEKHRTYGVDGVMIGRGIFTDPWIFDKTTKPVAHTYVESLSLLLSHAQLYHATWGQTRKFGAIKKFVKMYVKGFKGADELRTRLMQCKTHQDFADCLSTYSGCATSTFF